MAVSFNKVIIAGNLTRDPEPRTTQSGKTVVRFSIAVNDFGSQEASFFTVVAWEKLADVCQQYLTKGKPVLVEGRLQSRSFTNQSGEKRSSFEIVAQNIQFLGSNERKEASVTPYEAQKRIESVSDDVYSHTDVPFGDASKQSDDDIPF